jgi:hypothetical protein
MFVHLTPRHEAQIELRHVCRVLWSGANCRSSKGSPSYRLLSLLLLFGPIIAVCHHHVPSSTSPPYSQISVWQINSYSIRYLTIFTWIPWSKRSEERTVFDFRTSVYLDSLWQPIEKCTAFLVCDTDVSSDRIFFCKPCISWNHGSWNCLNRQVQTAESAVRGKRLALPLVACSHTLCGSTMALFEQKTSGRRSCRSVVVRSMEQVAVWLSVLHLAVYP